MGRPSRFGSLLRITTCSRGMAGTRSSIPHARSHRGVQCSVRCVRQRDSITFGSMMAVTALTTLAQAGQPDWVIQAQIGHVAPSMMKTYSHRTMYRGPSMDPRAAHPIAPTRCCHLQQCPSAQADWRRHRAQRTGSAAAHRERHPRPVHAARRDRNRQSARETARSRGIERGTA